MIRDLDDSAHSRIAGMVVGPSGIGKTFLAGTLDGMTLMASAEGGEMSLKKLPKEIRDRIKVWDINTMKDLKDFYVYCTKDEAKKRFQNIFIDSTTEIGEKLLIELKNDPKYIEPKMALAMYGKFNDDFTGFIKALMKMKPYNVWFTCLNKYEKDGLELREEFNFPGAKVKDNIKSWFDIVIKYEYFEKEEKKHRTFVTDDEVNRLAKDRSGLLNRYEKPHLGELTTKILKGGEQND